MNKKAVVSLLPLILPFGSDVNAALSADSLLSFNDGVLSTSYYGGLVTTSGSYFAMDTAGDGILDATDRVAISMSGGIRIGVTQELSGVSHTGVPTGTEATLIDNGWAFLANTGVHNTVSPVNIISDDGFGNVQLDFTGWRVDWNGIEDINLGGSPGDFPVDTGIAILTCAIDCSFGDTYTLDYTAHVPLGDPTGFGGVYYGLHLEGVISAVPVPAAVWLFGSGLLALAGLSRRKRTWY